MAWSSAPVNTAHVAATIGAYVPFQVVATQTIRKRWDGAAWVVIA